MNTARSQPVRCLKDGCDMRWPRDPALEVPCPDCGAGIGRKCKRPSGHAAWQNWVHASRDIAADQAGHYGVCPHGRCGLANGASTAPSPEQPSLF